MRSSPHMQRTFLLVELDSLLDPLPLTWGWPNKGSSIKVFTNLPRTAARYGATHVW